jgi:hypothetical protein
VVVMRVRGLPLVSSCATGRRCTCALIRRSWWRKSGPWQVCDVGAPTGAVTMRGRSTRVRCRCPAAPICSSPRRTRRPRCSATRGLRPGSLRRRRHDPASDQCSGRRSMCGTGTVGGSGRLPTTNCVTLVVRRLRTHAGHPKSCDHSAFVKTSQGKAAKKWQRYYSPH